MRRTLPFTRADRYLFALMLPRMAVALAVTLAALIVERVLRLFDFVIGEGAELGPVVAMALNLVPHYLGLALPAAFCIGILAALAVLTESNEIDALEGAGWSLRRIGAPFLLASGVFAAISLGLFGYVQPYSRYAYDAIRHEVLNAGWNGRVQAGVFLDVGDDMLLAVTGIDPGGRHMTGVFLLRETPRGPIASTAAEGVVVPDPDRGTLHLVLRDGQSLMPDGALLDFDRLRIGREFALDGDPFRPRGAGRRELTLDELAAELRTPPGGAPPDPALAVELHDRLIRAISLIGVALISVPLGVTRKRSPGWQRIAMAVALLALYDNMIKFVGGLGRMGSIDPALGLWGLALAFNGFGLWLYLSTPGQGADTLLRRCLRWIAEHPLRLAGLWPRRRPARTGR